MTLVWTSPAPRAAQTTEVIADHFKKSGITPTITELEKLWSDYKHKEDFEWLSGEINDFEGENLLIITHLEYVEIFPVEMWGYSLILSGYASGYTRQPNGEVNVISRGKTML